MEELTINGENQKYTYVIYDNHKGISTKINDKDSYFRGYSLNVSIKANLGGEVVYFLNENEYITKFNNTFIHVSNGESTMLSIDVNLNVKYLNKETKGYFVYTPTLKNPFVEFEIDNVIYQFEILQENISSYILKQGDNVLPFFTKNVVESTYDQYTSHHQIDIVYDENGLIYKGKKVEYSIEPYYVEYYFTYVYSMKFTLDNKIHILQLGLNGLINEYITIGDEEFFETSYIPYDIYLDLIGTYTYEGKYGPESFTLTDDGHFYADTLNDSGDGLVYDVEYEYNLYIQSDNENSNVPVIAFYYPKLNTTVYLFKIGYNLVAFNLNYTIDYIFNFKGAYYSENNEHAIYLVDDILYIDGIKAEINEVSHSEFTTIFSCVVDGVDTIVTFLDENGAKTVNVKQGEINYSASIYNLDINVFAGTYTYNDKTYEFKIVTDPITGISKYAFSDGFINYDYVVCAHNGHIAIKISILFDTYYLYVDGDSVLLDVEQGMIPPPPPLNAK